jgi:hypothetical protein
MNRRTVWIMCLLIGVLGLLGVAYRLLQTSSFDRIKWQQADTPSEFRDRRAMMSEVDRMIDQGTISSRASALQYLGPPQRGDVADGRKWYYSLGGSRSAESAPEAITWLVLTFDSAGNIAHHSQIQEEPMEEKDGGTGGS